MTTPICDFVRRYAARQPMRLHMPGHKGTPVLGMETLDITEIEGADSLFEADGIIAESERNAGSLFGANTFYSTEGSSLGIRAMLYLTVLYAHERGIQHPQILAGRNAHKTFLSAAALLDLDVAWLYPEATSSYLSGEVKAEELERRFCEAEVLPVAVYVTCPDYLGGMSDIEALAKVCHRYGVLLLVDNAHGAYLKFLPNSRHPMDLGADLCCDSAHKTLPVLTGGAYLHVAHSAPRGMAERAKQALAMFGSTSPSYLILQSLDAANHMLADGAYAERLKALSEQLSACRMRLAAHGLSADGGSEALKLTICPRSYGYTGVELGQMLREQGIECEFADPDFLVLMFTPAISAEDIEQLMEILLEIPRRIQVTTPPPPPCHPRQVMSIREAAFSPSEMLPIEQCLGRILAVATVGCPPAVPIVVCGERIDADAMAGFAYYGIQNCTVVREI